MMIRLIPKIFFNRMDEGLDLFVNCLGFKVLHQDNSLAVVGKEGAKAYVVESPEYAAKDRPEITGLGARLGKGLFAGLVFGFVYMFTLNMAGGMVMTAHDRANDETQS